MMETPPTLILGAGWLGQQWCLKNSSSLGTKRQQRESDFLIFDLRKRETWINIFSKANQYSQILWTFPPASKQEDLPILNDFGRELRQVWQGRLLVWGTTSVWQGSGIQTESSCLQPSLRVEGENVLIKYLNASVLHLCGLFGPKRSPLSWLIPRSSYIDKRIHLIHSDDVIELTEQLFKSLPVMEKRCLLAPFHSFRWSKHVFAYQSYGLLDKLMRNSINCSKERSLKPYKILKWTTLSNFKQPCYDEDLKELRNIRLLHQP
jgi:hypothetical protein